MMRRKHTQPIAFSTLAAIVLIFMANSIPTNSSSTSNSRVEKRAAERRKSAEELGVPECKSNFDCVVGGVCIKDRGGKGRCFCSSSCPLNVPVQCVENNQYSCVSMGDSYTSRYDLRNPLCYHKRCICPPQFDPNLVLPPVSGFKTRLPMKCDKRELNVVIAATPSDAVYKGMVAYLFCCINMDPRGFIGEDSVFFIQNGTRRREPTSTPYENFSSDIDTLFSVPTCWILGINNVQLSDSGTYQCHVQPGNSRYPIVNATMEFVVKTPRVIQNITIMPNITSVVISWDTQDGAALRIDMDLFKRSDRKMRAAWKMNVKSPVTFDHLSPATPYTLFIKVTEGHNQPFEFTEQFITSDDLPDPPVLEDIRLVNAENGKGQMCEVEWRPPANPRGLITRYYVQISGRMRHISPDSKIPPTDHYPQGVDVCSNYEQDAEQFINPSHFHSFFACKYGPLKPNRNYTATVWAANRAGESRAASFHGHCVMDFAEPEKIEPPETLARTNISSFGLRFGEEPDQGNGPIACYYLAILPLPVNASIEGLPSRELIVMDTFDKALQNNLHQSAISNNRFFAYIAESYLQYPKQTVIGDGDTSGGKDPCNVLYLTRFKPNDPALTPDLKYTGFLIARVDRDPTLHANVAGSNPAPTTMGMQSASPLRSGRRLARRQLTNPDPAYGYSDYFKPVILQVGGNGMSGIELFLICLFLLLFVVLSSSTVVYFMHKRGMIKQFCPVKKGSHDILRPAVPPAPLRADDLPAEYILRHRDSDYQFTQEFEMLPRGKNLDHTISERKENARKNRYNDIKACDATRVRLKRIPGDPNSSDYINANFIKGYKGKKVFIATQGPLECTTSDFWRMVWEQGSRLVIMVTNLRERGREQCAKYWPDEEESPLVFRTLEISPLDSAYFADYTVRNFELSDMEPPPPPPTRANGRVGSGAGSSSSSPPPLDESRAGPPPNRSQQQSPTPNATSPLIGKMGGGSNPMNSSAYSIHSRHSSMHDFDRHSSISPSTSTQRHRPDSEYANIASIIRPHSKCSERASMADGREKRKVIQYHFTSWNDYKAPECTIALLRLLCKLRRMDEYNQWPVVVHCSAGVGRTGTLVAIDHVLDQVMDTGIADVFGCVAEMRQQRNLMVQSVEQYVFIYKALAEYQLFGDTDLTVPEFRRHFAQLRQPLQAGRERHFSIGSTRSSSTVHFCGSSTDKQGRQRTASNSTREREGIGAALRAKLRQLRAASCSSTSRSSEPQQHHQQQGNGVQLQQNGGIILGSGHHHQRAPKTQLEMEFQDLSITLERPKPSDWAHREENAIRNRFADAVPFNHNRVILQPMLGYDNTYVNASLVKGYFYPYILAQDPLGPETAFDFWRMINDQQTYTLVMFNEQDFLPHEMYWPREVTKRLVLGKNNELTITLAEEVVQPGFVQRKLHYRFKQPEKSNSTTPMGRDVVQFSFRPWRKSSNNNNRSSATIPTSSAQALLDLIGRVLERQSNIPDAGPIILHCRDGSAENGIFCCVSLLLERLRSEHMIDVFRTVKSLQMQRPLLFSKIDQYAFCYDCVMEYLNSTSTHK